MSNIREHAKALSENCIELIEQILIKHNKALLEEVKEQIKKRDAKINELEAQINQIESIMHYPGCWDTVAYPSVADAVIEIRDRCMDCTEEDSK